MILKHKQLKFGGKQRNKTMIQAIQLLASAPPDLEGDVKSFSIRVVLTASLVLIVLMVIAAIIVNNKRFHFAKKPLFMLIVATITIPTLLMAGSTVYINTISESKGPVHWHADIEFWVCGQEIAFRDPTGFLSNKTGSSTFHEHNDKRMHLEGVVVNKSYDASLEKYMLVTGGGITQSSITIPTNDDFIEDDTDGDVPRGDIETVRQFFQRDRDGRAIIVLENGQECEPGFPAELQVFVIQFNKENDTYTQTKLEDPSRYIMRDESIVPPGDCVIVEFDRPKLATDRLCREYGVRDIERCVEFGVREFNPELCNLRMVLTEEQQRSLEGITAPDNTMFEIDFELEQDNESTESPDDTQEGEL